MSKLAKKLIEECLKTQNTYLDIGNCGITELNQIPELFECTHLETLVLSNEWYELENSKWVKKQSDNSGKPNLLSSLPEGLKKLQNLKNIISCGEHNSTWYINDIAVLAQITSLTHFNLSYNQISNIQHLYKLTSLTHLDLYYNPIKNIDPLGKLTSLNNLDLSGNQINNIEPLEKLTSLNYLDLSGNQISNIEPLDKLTSLNKLDLSENQISNIEPLDKLISLNNLNLRGNQINNIEPLNKLTSINILNISGNQINNIEPLHKLTRLNNLYLSTNQISNIEPLDKLIRLNYLDLRQNQISNIEPLDKLSRLDYLDLRQNQISNIEPLDKLTRLANLNLSYNQISDIEPLEKLTSLNYLDLRQNQINTISPIKHLIKNNIPIKWDPDYSVHEIVIGYNPLSNPSIEIVKQGNEAIIRYFEALEKQGSDNIHEAKVTLVGEGNAGKTTLLRKLIAPNAEPPKSEDRTRGIAIADWEFDTENKKHIAHIWDFGGQDVYYPVHRFFLTENSVFVLMASTRQNTHEFNYWIPTIFQFGGKSPIILAQTCHDGNAVAWNDIGAYVANDNFTIIVNSSKYYHELNLLKENQGLAEISKSIIHQISNLPHISKVVPKSWIPVREMVKDLQENNCIAFDSLKEKIQTAQPEFFQNKVDVEDCIQFLHDIGILLWYRKEKKLKDWIILNPKWAVDAVYKIIDDEIVQKQKGIVYDQDFTRVWCEKIYDSKHEILKKMLEVFKIAFPKKSHPNDYIIPTRLESIPSQEIWNDDKSCLRMEYNFEFMPKGMVNQISAELSRYIVADNQIWNNAVNFKHERSTAQVFEDFYFRKITVKAKGEDARAMMLLNMNAVKDISDGYKGVFPKISIPCPCDECSKRDKPEYFEYDDLLEKLKKKPNPTITCRKSDEIFEINELLSTQGLPNPVKDRREAEERKSLRTIKIFLASSNEMKNERDQFRIFIGTLNDSLHRKGIYLQIVQWEHYLEDIALDGKQHQLNAEIKDCQMALCLFFTKVGKYTEQEFDAAFEALKTNAHFKVYTYFKNAPINTGEIKRDDINSLLDFKEKLTALGHFIFEFKNPDQLHNKFSEQLNKYLES